MSSTDYDDLDTEVWEEDEDAIEYEVEEDVQVLAPRIMAGHEDKQHWQAEMPGGGMMATTAEGAFGKILRKRAMASRTDEERFRDNIVKVAREAEISYSIRDAVLILIPRIPDIRFKSPAGTLFGYMSMDFVGIPLNKASKKELDKILERVRGMKDRNLRISELDVVRYARMLQSIIGNRDLFA